MSIQKLSQALFTLLDELDNGAEYPEAEHRIAQQYGIKQKDLREAYDEFTSVPHNPFSYL